MTRCDPDEAPGLAARVAAMACVPRSITLLLVTTLLGVSMQSALGAEAQGASAKLRQIVPQAADSVCGGNLDTPPVSSAELLGSHKFEVKNGEGVAYRWRLPSGEEMRVTQLTTSKQPGPLYFLDVYSSAGGAAARPLLRGVVNGQCRFLGGQDVLYSQDDPGKPFALQRLNPSMQPAKQPSPLNPPVPKAAGDPSCIRVGILDNGVNYLLPEIEPRLARDAKDRLVGYDYWDDDDRPMDYGYPPRSLDPRISPFSPRHHGTAVASIFLAEAPASACVAPYRYFPADESGGSDPRQMIDDMADAGVKIVNLSSGRDKPWPEFRDAMRAHPDMLFVLAAGNNGRDLGQEPSYPAAYRLDNVVVVAATGKDGTLWEQSNRGADVDVAILAVDIPSIVYDGSHKELTGTSMAAPRVAAFAARLLAASPGASAAELKRRILKQAQASGKEADGIPVLMEQEIKIR